MQTVALTDLNIAEVYLQLGEGEKAEEVLLEAVEIFDQGVIITNINPRALLAYARAQSGEFQSAHQLLREAQHNNAERGSWPTAKWFIRRCEALVAAYEGDFDQANQIFEEVVEAYERMEARLYRTQVLREWGQLLSESENPDDKKRARKILADALAGYQAMGAPMNAAWVVEEKLAAI
jgi:tetratricopeptide (TPR) repeat protein